MKFIRKKHIVRIRRHLLVIGSHFILKQNSSCPLSFRRWRSWDLSLPSYPSHRKHGIPPKEIAPVQHPGGHPDGRFVRFHVQGENRMGALLVNSCHFPIICSLRGREKTITLLLKQGGMKEKPGRCAIILTHRLFSFG